MSSDGIKIIRSELVTEHRTFNIEIREEPERTLVKLVISKYGDYPDFDAFMAWYAPLIVKYEGDGKPVVLTHPLTGERATAYDSGFGIITPPANEMN